VLATGEMSVASSWCEFATHIDADRRSAALSVWATGPTPPRLSTARSTFSGRLPLQGPRQARHSATAPPQPVTDLAALRLPPNAPRAGMLFLYLGWVCRWARDPPQAQKMQSGLFGKTSATPTLAR
jgi:hypothetical protein